MSPMGAAIQKTTTHMQPPLQRAEWKRTEWVINSKVPKTFVLFNDQTHEYRNWYNRVRDHLIMSNVGWGSHP